MRIVSQSSNQLVLKEGSTQGIVVGAVLVVAGALAGIFLRETNPYVIWIGVAVAVAGIAVIFFSSSITVTANKASGQMLYQKKRIVGAQDSTYAIADIFRIETRKQWQVQNAAPSPNQQPSMPQLVAQSVIVFKDGREVPLDHQKTSSTTTVGPVVLMGGQGAETAIAAQVAKFLNVPFQEIAPPNMGMGAIQL
jgi:Tfp pilus assembly PilM family ATPase